RVRRREHGVIWLRSSPVERCKQCLGASSRGVGARQQVPRGRTRSRSQSLALEARGRSNRTGPPIALAARTLGTWTSGICSLLVALVVLTGSAAASVHDVVFAVHKIQLH